MIISLIAALDKNRLIGSNNGMPWHLPADFRHFKEVTMGKPVIMGRKTFESIGRPLPGRQNIVISRSGFSAEGITSADSIDMAIQLAGDVDEVMIIGGANIYHQTIDRADRLYLSHVDVECEGDAWFPEYINTKWNVVSETSYKSNEKNKFNFKVCIYERV